MDTNKFISRNRITKKYKSVNREEAIETIMHYSFRDMGDALFNYICGDLIGFGITRYVFEYKPDPEWVMKIDVSNYFANINEWLLWGAIKDDKRYNKWYAPVKDISACGKFMLQKYCTPLSDTDNVPKMLPINFHDIKKENFGLLDERVVLIDYGGQTFMDALPNKIQLKKANWIL